MTLADAHTIDAHQHFWALSRGDYFWMSPDLKAIYRDFSTADLQPILARHGIGGTVLVQAAASVEETEYMLGIADATPWVKGVVGWIDFEHKEHLKHLERFARHPKFRGVRPMIQDIPDMDWMLRSDIDWAYRAIADLDLRFDALGFPRHLANFLTLLGRHPGMKVVVDHCMKPQIRDLAFENWAEGIAAIAQGTGACVKLSGLVTEAGKGWIAQDLRPYVDHVISSFGAQRVMWGSDWPVVDLNGDYDSWRKASLELIGDRQGRDAILGGTARAFYRLD